MGVLERYGSGDIASFGVMMFWVYFIIMNWRSIYATTTWTYVHLVGYGCNLVIFLVFVMLASADPTWDWVNYQAT